MLWGITISSLIGSVSQGARCHWWVLHSVAAIKVYFVEMLLPMSRGVLHSWGAEELCLLLPAIQQLNHRRNSRGAINGFKAVNTTWRTTVTLWVWMSPRNCKPNIKSSKEHNVVTSFGKMGSNSGRSKLWSTDTTQSVKDKVVQLEIRRSYASLINTLTFYSVFLRGKLCATGK